MNTLTITVLVENTVRKKNLIAEHGLAFWIEMDSHNILFDTGQGMALLKNAVNLGVPLNNADAIVLSHGHYDHTGGLKDVLRMTGESVKVYAHPAAFKSKFVRDSNGCGRSAGMPGINEEEVLSQVGGFIWTEGPTEIIPGLFVTGQIPRENDFEDTGGDFYTDRECRHDDFLLDDQAMYFKCVEGLVVILGCGHSGVINTLQYIQKLTGEQDMHALLGGMHLLNASPERLEKTMSALREMRISHIYPAHCTGFHAVMRLFAEFPDICLPCDIGTKISFQLV